MLKFNLAVLVLLHVINLLTVLTKYHLFACN